MPHSHEGSWLRWTVIEQANYNNTTFCLYFLKEILLAQFQSLGGSNRDAFLENEGKIHEGRFFS